MANSKRKFRGTDRAQSFFRAQREIDEAEFKAIEARYRKEVYKLADGTEARVISEVLAHKPVSELPAPIPMLGRMEDEDSLLDLAIAHQPHVVHREAQNRADDEEMKAALRARGVTFNREPKSIHASVPSGRIGSIPRPTTRSKPKEVDNRSIMTPDRSIDDHLSRKGLTPQRGHR